MQGILLVLSLLVTLAAQIYINSSYNKTKRIKNRAGITGAQTARKILDENGLSNVKVEEVTGILGDHYDPRTKTVRLSSDIYSTISEFCIIRWLFCYFNRNNCFFLENYLDRYYS